MTTVAINAGFDLDLKAILPRLRVYALSLTRNKDRADDLVQQTALKALAGRASFQVGSNFSGWIFRIQRNEFISELRRDRPTVELELAGGGIRGPRAAAPGTPDDPSRRSGRLAAAAARRASSSAAIPDRGLFVSGDRQPRRHLHRHRQKPSFAQSHRARAAARPAAALFPARTEPGAADPAGRSLTARAASSRPIEEYRRSGRQRCELPAVVLQPSIGLEKEQKDP